MWFNINTFIIQTLDTDTDVPASAKRLMVFSIQRRNDQRIICRGPVWQAVACILLRSTHLKKFGLIITKIRLFLQVMMIKMRY